MVPSKFSILDSSLKCGGMSDCQRCGNPLSSTGHATSVCKKYTFLPEPGLKKGERLVIIGRMTQPRHMCCPDNCQFDHPDEFEADIKMFEQFGHNALTEEPKRALEFLSKNLPNALDKTTLSR